MEVVDATRDLLNRDLLAAAKANNLALVKELLDKGADADYEYNNRNSGSWDDVRDCPLHHAVQHANLEMARLLLSKGALNMTQAHSPTPCRRQDDEKIRKPRVESRQAGHGHAIYLPPPKSVFVSFCLLCVHSALADSAFLDAALEFGADVNVKISDYTGGRNLTTLSTARRCSK